MKMPHAFPTYSSKLIFDPNGGTVSTGSNEVSGKYESRFNSDETPEVQRNGWTFGGWIYNGKLVSNSSNKIENESFGLENKTFFAYWKSTESVKTTTFFGDISLNKNQDAGKVTCSVSLPSGYESQNWSYKWYVDGVYVSDETEFTRTPQALGRGVHTITVRASMNGNSFTSRVTVTIE